MPLEARKVGFRYGDRWLFRNVDFRLEEGMRVGLVSPSGSGKSTLAKILAGHLKATEGVVLADGKPLPRRGVSPVQLIYQHPEEAVNPRWRMKQVLAEAGIEGPAMSVIERMGIECMGIERMGIEPKWLERFPRELSGGELQRFCIARSLCAGTRFLLADEITAMLDVITQAQIGELILREAARRRLGLFVITHNEALAQRLCTRIVRLEDLSGNR
ncbi:MAG: ATP-binding cassette domain-containing protein [Spirochaetaceae bacterium]|jgi:peptide/nickel transport system ATP-binding protein|nr:ATP-binding cassette domain-containing protein [Spirochaetaceae bacterium]